MKAPGFLELFWLPLASLIVVPLHIESYYLTITSEKPQPWVYAFIAKLASKYLTKVSKEKTKIGKNLLSPIDLNKAFHERFYKRKWEESRYNYYITLNRELMEKSVLMSAREQKEFLINNGVKEPIYSYNQTDFVKNKVAVEVQFGKYAFVAFDLFVKHMLFYSGGVINLGIEILPTKKMQNQMSSGVAYYEGEVYNVMRQGRNSPPVPLLILGIEP